VRCGWRAGLHGDGGGLYLQVGKSGTKSWLFRYWVPERNPATGDLVVDVATGKRRGRIREMGLASCMTISPPPSFSEAEVPHRPARVISCLSRSAFDLWRAAPDVR